MSSQFKIHTKDFGTLSVFAISSNSTGRWESEWAPLQDAGLEDVLDLLSPISYIAYSELRSRHAIPFLEEVGLPAKACLQKLKPDLTVCLWKSTCPSYDAKACDANLKAPVCFDPNIDDPELRLLVARLIDFWRMGFYVITVTMNE